MLKKFVLICLIVFGLNAVSKAGDLEDAQAQAQAWKSIANTELTTNSYPALNTLSTGCPALLMRIHQMRDYGKDGVYMNGDELPGNIEAECLQLYTDSMSLWQEASIDYQDGLSLMSDGDMDFSYSQQWWHIYIRRVEYAEEAEVHYMDAYALFISVTSQCNTGNDKVDTANGLIDAWFFAP